MKMLIVTQHFGQKTNGKDGVSEAQKVWSNGTANDILQTNSRNSKLVSVWEQERKPNNKKQK